MPRRRGSGSPPGDSGVIVGGGTVTPVVGDLPGANGFPPDSIDSPPDKGTIPPRGIHPPSGSGDIPPSSGNTSPPGSGGGSSGGGSQTGDGENPTSPGGFLRVYGENREGGYAEWVQSSDIDLFYNRVNGAQEKIAPGTFGYYQFRLQNTRTSRLDIRIALAENGLHLPLRFTLTPLGADGGELGGQAVSGFLPANGSLVLDTAIDGGAVVTYRLDWEWPVDGNDALDTQIGTGADLVYLLSMAIHAEEI